MPVMPGPAFADPSVARQMPPLRPAPDTRLIGQHMREARTAIDGHVQSQADEGCELELVAIFTQDDPVVYRFRGQQFTIGRLWAEAGWHGRAGQQIFERSWTQSLGSAGYDTS